MGAYDGISDDEILKEYQAREDAKVSLAGYARYVGEVEPARHHQIICDVLDDALEYLCQEKRGNEPRYIIIAAPPGSAKSTYTSHLFPALAMARLEGRGGDNHRRVVVCSFGKELSNEIGDKVRKNLDNENHRRIFPEAGLNLKKKAVNNFEATNGTAFYSTSAGGQITGKRADLLIIDDPIKGRINADNKAEREKLWKWYKADVKSRVKPGGVVIVIATRWHEDDLTGKLLTLFDETKTPYKYIKFEALCDDPESDPLGRERGEALWPEWENAALLENKRDVDYRDDPREWSSLYQQRPSPQDGNLVLRTWFQPYVRKEMETIKNELIFYQSWDTAGNARAKNDPSVCVTFAVNKMGDIFLWDVHVRRMEYPELQRDFVIKASEFNPSAILVENKGTGQSLLQTYKKGVYNLVECNPGKEGDKEFRFERALPTLEAGKLHVDKSLVFSAAYVEELVTFPAAKHDDQVDATSQFVNWLSARRGRARGQMKLRGM